MPNYAIVKINGQAVPAEVSYGNLTLGTGNISVFTGNNSVVGYDTSFNTELGNGYVIRSNAGVYVGKISNVISSNSAILTANASVAITDDYFRFQPFYANVITYNETSHLGNGNISVFSTNSTVIGTNTTFLSQLDLGFQLFTANASLIGVVKNIYSNTSAELTTVAANTFIDSSYLFYDPSITSSNLIPKHSQLINNALLEWGKSGLLQNTVQVKSFHPPIPDPVTGVLVNFPATVHQNGIIKNFINHDYANNHLDNVSGFSSLIGNAIVKSFDSDNGIVGSSIFKALKSIPINNLIKQIVANSSADHTNDVISTINSTYGDPSTPKPPGLVVDSPPQGFTLIPSTSITTPPYNAYQGPGGNVVYVFNQSSVSTLINTAADTFAIAANQTPPSRIVTDQTDATQYFAVANPASNLTDAQKADLTARATTSIQTAPGFQRLTLSGIPAAIPGQMNAILADLNPANRTYKQPSYTTGYAYIFGGYNYKLPSSPINVPPSMNYLANIGL
jgi:hypothetical protein